METSKCCPPRYATYKGGQLLKTSAEALNADDTTILQKKFFACLDTGKNAKKPADPAAASRAVENREFKAWGLSELAGHLSNGATILPGYCGGTRKKDRWEAQQLWFVDVDNDPATLDKGFEPLGYAAALKRCWGLALPLVISYETFSSSDPTDTDPAHQRFRLVFAQDDAITDEGEAARFGDALLAAFPECDPSTTQPNRLFFGTDKGVQAWLN